MVAIRDSAIDLNEVLRSIGTDATGGIDVFVGTVRNHSDGKQVEKLEYSAYAPMAEEIMQRVEREIREKWDVHNVIILHRVGTLAIGDIAVVTAVAATHRAEAFEACRYAIERVKADAPIWKKEFTSTTAAVGATRGVAPR
jgi:molybdopterin synthase catalytic subunit